MEIIFMFLVIILFIAIYMAGYSHAKIKECQENLRKLDLIQNRLEECNEDQLMISSELMKIFFKE